MVSSIFSIILFSFLFFFPVYPDTVGSNVSVSIEPFYTFPNTHNNDNAILAFAWMQHGFALQDSVTTCSFMSAFPVSGTVDLNGGVLTLNQDLILQDEVCLEGIGTILGSNRVLDICSSVTTLAVSNGVISGIRIDLREDILLTGTLTFYGNCTISGNGHTLTLDPHAQLIVGQNATLGLLDLDVSQVHSNNIKCQDDSGVLSLDDVRLILSNDYVFQKGSILFQHDVYLMGNYHTFTYESNCTSTICPESTLCVRDGANFFAQKATVNANQPLYQQDRSANLTFDNGNLVVGPNGLQFLNGTIQFQHTVDIIVTGTSADTGLIIGNSVSTNDPLLYLSSDGVINHITGYVTFNTASSNVIQSGGPSAILMRQNDSFFIIETNLTVPQVTLQLASELVPPLQVAPGAVVLYDNSSVILPDVELKITGEQPGPYTYSLIGGSALLFNRGELPIYVLVSGVHNLVEGNGGISGPIIFQDSATQLSSDIFGRIDNMVMFNNGSLLLEDNLRLGPNASLVGPGSIVLGEYIFDLGPGSFIGSSPIKWSGMGGAINLNGALTLSSTWTVSGTCIFNGNDNIIALQSGGSIVIADNSSLTLKRVKLVGLQGYNLVCSADSASITCADAELFLSGDYTFTTGSFYFDRNNLMQGNGHNFVYTSNQTSTIAGNATLTVNNTLINLGKQVINQNSPLVMETPASTFALDNVVWTIPAGGFQISQGILQFMDQVTLSILSTSTLNGLYLGAPVGDNVVIDFTAGSVVTQKSGHIVLDMDNPNAFIVRSQSAQFSRNPGTVLDIKKNLNFVNLTSLTSPGSPMVVEGNALVTYNNVRQQVLASDTIVTGTRYNATTILLDHGGVFDIRTGTQPGSVRVSGSGGVLQGSGNLGGSLTLTGTDAVCFSGFVGSFLSNITLNGGVLNVIADVNLANGAQLLGPGTILLNGHNVNFGKTDWVATTPLMWQGQGGTLNLGGDFLLSSTWTFSGNCEIRGNGHVFDLGSLGQVNVTPGSRLILQDVVLKNIARNNLLNSDNTSSMVLNSVDLIQSDDFIFRYGSLLIQADVRILGGYNFIYDSIMSSTIDAQASLYILNFSNFTLNTYQPLAQIIEMVDATSNLALEDCTLTITGLGVRFTKGKVYCQNDVTIDIISTSTNSGLVLGNNIAQEDLSFELRPGTTVNYPRGHLLTQLINPYAINAKSNTAQIIRGNDSFFYLDNTTILQNLTLNTSEYAVLQTAPGAQFIYNNVSNVLPMGNFDISGAFYGGFINLLNGPTNYLSLSRGIYPLVTAIGAPGSTMMGNGTIMGPTIFLGPGSFASWILNGVCDSYIDMNGSTLYLGRDLVFGPNGDLNGPGAINISSYSVVFNPKNSLFDTPLTWIADHGAIELKNDVVLDSTWVITGTCTINGNGHSLTFGTSGSIQLSSGSMLRLSNIDVDGVAGTNIACVDDAGIIVLDDVLWHQSSDYQFVAGAFQFNGDIRMLGSYNFVYQSNQTSRLYEEAHLILDTGFTFSYDPSSQASDRIAFFDKTAVLELSGGILDSTHVGMNLTRGSLVVSSNSAINAQADGISFGSGIVGDDMHFNIKENRQVTVNSGVINYKNIDQASFGAYDNRSRINMQANTGLYLYETLDLGEGNVYTQNNVTLAIASGKDLIGSIFPNGTLLRISI